MFYLSLNNLLPLFFHYSPDFDNFCTDDRSTRSRSTSINTINSSNVDSEIGLIINWIKRRDAIFLNIIVWQLQLENILYITTNLWFFKDTGRVKKLKWSKDRDFDVSIAFWHSLLQFSLIDVNDAEPDLQLVAVTADNPAIANLVPRNYLSRK